MFSGNFEYTVDERGRVAIPAVWRNAPREGKLLENLVITRGFDPCIAVYTQKQWVDSFESNIQNLDYAKPEHRNFIHMFISARVEDTMDKQGRVLLPASLRSEFDIQREVIIVGAGKHFEVWNAEAYRAHIEKIRAGTDGIFAAIGFKL